MPYNPEKEKQILKAVTDYLQLLENQKKLYFCRVGSGGIKTETGHWFKTGKTGMADLIIFVRGGKYIMAECKAKYGAQSEAQKEVEGRIKMLGGEYHIIRGVTDMLAVLTPYLIK